MIYIAFMLLFYNLNHNFVALSRKTFEILFKCLLHSHSKPFVTFDALTVVLVIYLAEQGIAICSPSIPLARDSIYFGQSNQDKKKITVAAQNSRIQETYLGFWLVRCSCLFFSFSIVIFSKSSVILVLIFILFHYIL